MPLPAAIADCVEAPFRTALVRSGVYTPPEGDGVTVRALIFPQDPDLSLGEAGASNPAFKLHLLTAEVPVKPIEGATFQDGEDDEEHTYQIGVARQGPHAASWICDAVLAS